MPRIRGGAKSAGEEKINMEIAMIGLGKMGANMTTRLLGKGHRVVAFDVKEEAVRAAEAGGATGARTLDEAVGKLSAPRAVWVMVPSGKPTDDTIAGLAERLSPGDIVVDGGNSNYKTRCGVPPRSRKKDCDSSTSGPAAACGGYPRGTA